MKGATIGHAKQRIRDGRYIGLTEPGIIAAEPPNPIVNQLVIMPDIEKRLEAFVRIGHGIVVFPGGAGTAEEILYLLGILLDPAERGAAVARRVHRSRAAARSISRQIDAFLVGDARRSACASATASSSTIRPRWRARWCAGWTPCASSGGARSDAYNFNWLLRIPHEFQQPFEATHAAMAGARAAPRHAAAPARGQPAARVLRHRRRQRQGSRASGSSSEHGPFELHGDPEMLRPLDELLRRSSRSAA